MEITTLVEIPKLEHDEEIGGYAYPEEYRNKLYIFKDQYIYVKSGSYESFPKFILDTIIEDYLSKSNSETPIYNEEYINQRIQEQIVTALDAFNSRFEQLYEQFNDKVSLEQLHDFLESYKNSLNLTKNDTCMSECVTKEYFVQELEVVHQNMLTIIENTIRSNISNMPAVQSSIQPELASKLPVSKLLLLKECGYSVKEIKDLTDCGLI